MAEAEDAAQEAETAAPNVEDAAPDAAGDGGHAQADGDVENPPAADAPSAGEDVSNGDEPSPEPDAAAETNGAEGSGPPATDAESSDAPVVDAAPARDPNSLGGVEAAADQPTDEDSASVPEDDLDAADELEVVIIEGKAPTAGSVQTVQERELERFEHDDVHKVLAAVPGVYIREEDGYGLRPNIGMRGSGSERSAKIALMEDGLLIAPAPYSAPAAYYFPLTTKMVAVEVFKGPAAVRFGPNTVGGAVNMVNRQIPKERVAAVDIAGGNNNYGKSYMYYGDRTENMGWLFEVAKIRSDGFKQLDGGGPTGFDKNDFGARFQIHSSPGSLVFHSLELALGFANEVSNESYTGLTDEDFAENPYRRYAGAQLDLMQWDHNTIRLKHKVSTSKFRATTTAYRHYFHRDWFKVIGFANGSSLRDIILFPTGNNDIYYRIFAGERDSRDPRETLLLGSNERWFESLGVQSALNLERTWLGIQHEIEIGTRLHFDEATRYHTQDGYLMQGGNLVADGMPTEITLDSIDSTLAWASYYDHKATLGKLTVSGGARFELVKTDHFNIVHSEAQMGIAPEVTKDNIYSVIVPGGGIVYTPLAGLEFLAGAHSGFVPVNPASVGIVQPERSLNYEAGGRYANSLARFEVIGFFSNYSNLNAPCRFSTGCNTAQVETQASAGRVHSYGAEALANFEFELPLGLKLPVQVAYTYQKSVFQEAFTSSNPQWGLVFPGFELPYVPAHQLSWQTALEGERWHIATSGRYQSKMRDIAGDLPHPGDTDPALIFNAAGSYGGRWGKLYVSVENLFDYVHITARRPLGARPGVPRRFVLGYKNSF